MRRFGPAAARRDIEASGWNIAIDHIVKAGEGHDAVAFVVNRDYVFLFAKHERAAEGLRREACLLPHLRPALDIAIPEVCFIGLATSRLPFVGYRWLNGVALSPALFQRLPDHRRRRVLAQLAAFLTALHAFPLPAALACGVPQVDAHAEAEADLARLAEKVFPILDAATRRHIESHYNRYLGTPENFAYTPALLHADISPEHVLYDRQRGEIAGIIDFGDLQIGDPDYDLMYVFEDWGETFVRSLLTCYPHSAPARLFEKLRFWYERNILRDLIAAIDEQDEAGIMANVAELCRRSRRH